MDRNSIIGLALIAVILITFGLLQEPTEPKNVNNNKVENVIDSTSKNTENKSIAEAVIDTTTNTVFSDSINIILDSIANIKQEAELQAKYGIFGLGSAGDDKVYTLENDKLIVEISSKGARPTSVRLKEFQNYKNFISDSSEIIPLQLFDKDSSRFNLTLVPTKLDRPLFTKDLYFTTLAPENVKITETAKSITFRLNTNSPSKYIEFVYSLAPNDYELNYTVNFVGLENELEPSINLDWGYNALSTEKSVEQERQICEVFYKYQNDDYDYFGSGSDDEQKLEATTEWVAFKHQYFSSIIYSKDGFSNTNSTLSIKKDNGNKYSKDYSAQLNLSKEITSNTSIPLSIYFGPNDYDILNSYEREYQSIINLGWGIFRWVNKWLIIPIFNVLNKLNLQIGILIILMTLIIKLIILPLTYKNYVSSAKMRVLKPEVDKINSKYADGKDAMKKQQEMMALYKSTGVNPMAGCIPMLIQMPILFAAFRFFPSSMELRQKSFLWAEDLSAYDAVLTWEAQIPLLSSIYGNHMSLFTILMCVSTLFYTMMNNQNMAQPTQPGMPNMKVMMYIFPFMMLFFFNKFSSGLSLYYLASNLMSMGMMWGIKTYMVDEDKIRRKIDENKKKPVKKSKFQQRLEDMARQQRQK